MTEDETERVHCLDCGCDIWDHNTGETVAMFGGCGSCGECERWR